MDDEGTDRLPTKEEAVQAFWEVIAPALLELHRQGLLPSAAEDLPAEHTLPVYRLPSGVPYTSKDVRNWLRAQGRTVHPVGRLPNSLLREYERAQTT